MARTSEQHHNLTNGVGKCSVPMWSMGYPDGFCDKPAYGKQMPSKRFRDAWTGRVYRADGKYDGIVSGLCCPMHGGPKSPYLDFVCDGPPGPEAGRFVEVEDATGKSINAGQWIKRSDGYWALRIELEEPRHD